MKQQDRVQVRDLVGILKRLKAAWAEDSQKPRVDPKSYHCGYCVGRADSYDFVIGELERRFIKEEVKCQR